jgi:preprotein translocase subunit YajC
MNERSLFKFNFEIMETSTIFFILVILAVIGLIVYYFLQRRPKKTAEVLKEKTETQTELLQSQEEQKTS